MNVTITVPDDLAARLQVRAAAQRRPAEEVALDLLRTALAAEPAEPVEPVLADVVARIRAIPPSPDGLRVARGNLVDALGDEPDSNLDVAAWHAAWSTVEAELAAIEHAGDRVEG